MKSAPTTCIQSTLESIGLDQRMKRERAVFESLIKTYGFKRALDAGCGSGFHSILLASLGLEVTGIDASNKMIHLAKSNARRYKISANFTKADFATFPHYVPGQFDSIFCLGNSLAHLLTNDELDTTVGNFRQVLKPGGFLIIQLLNYAKILKEKQRIVGITESDDKIFVRFYDFKEALLQFNILILTRKKGKFTHQWISTQLYPWCVEELRSSLIENGFNQIQIFSDLGRNEFEEASSQNLVVFCK
jgi:SAM-dependent methyltransferase